MAEKAAPSIAHDDDISFMYDDEADVCMVMMYDEDDVCMLALNPSYGRPARKWLDRND